jgi:hypothetical protein
MADVPDMGDPDMGDAAAGEDSPEPGSGHERPDRRHTIDLIRVERGEPERRRLLRDPKPPFSSGRAPQADDE